MSPSASRTATSPCSPVRCLMAQNYAFRCEWWELGRARPALISTEPEFGGEFMKNKITAFEAGKTYHYGVYVTAYTANISSNAKLIINGQEVSYTRIGSDGETQSLWVETNLTMMPQAGGTTPAEKYTVTYTDGVDNEESLQGSDLHRGSPARQPLHSTAHQPARAIPLPAGSLRLQP